MSKPVAFKPPKSLAACADMLYTKHQERLELQRQADALKAEEAILVEHFVQTLPKSDATGIQGKLARVTVVKKLVPSVVDWDLLRGYIVANQKKNPGVWSLLNKAVGAAAVKEMWERGVEVPGVEPLDVPTVSLNKV